MWDQAGQMLYQLSYPASAWDPEIEKQFKEQIAAKLYDQEAKTLGQHFVTEFFCCHEIRPLIPILTLLPFLCISKKKTHEFTLYVIKCLHSFW